VLVFRQGRGELFQPHAIHNFLGTFGLAAKIASDGVAAASILTLSLAGTPSGRETYSLSWETCQMTNNLWHSCALGIRAA
jgi:hypothetical protein